MLNPRKPKLLDLVAVLERGDDPNVEIGDVGTVVELLPPDGAEVEFLDRGGRTRCVATLRLQDVLVLNRQRTPVGQRCCDWAAYRRNEKQHGEYRAKRLILEMCDATATPIGAGQP